MVDVTNLQLLRLPHGKDLPLPAYAHPGDSGLDLAAAIDAPLVIMPNRMPTLIKTGFAIKLTPGYEAQVRSRSGLAIKKGVAVVQGVGTIDSSYRGEILVGLVNHGPEPHTINPGDRIAQLVIAPVAWARVTEVFDVGETSRGAGALGSTGV